MIASHRKAALALLFTLILSLSLYVHGKEVLATSGPITIVSGVNWYDTGGNVIHAHEGGVVKQGSTYYFIGLDAYNGTNEFNHVTCYSSSDLKSWTFVNNLLSQQSSGDLVAGSVVERPHVIYNSSTSTYVMWFHYDDATYTINKAGVATSSSLCGNYTYQGSVRPGGNDSLDLQLFKDTDGTAYIIYSTNSNADFRIDKLSSDYLTDVSNVKLFSGVHREAFQTIHLNGYYYMITSGQGGWDASQAKYQTATSLSGTWSAMTNIGDSRNDFSQGMDLLAVQGTSTTTYVSTGDRFNSLGNVNLSTYVWYPVTFSGTTISFAYNDTGWNIDTGTGISTSGTTIPQSQMSATATSAHTGYEAGKAIDGNTTTMWHSEWSPMANLPQSITVNLGGTYHVDKVRYLPRQDSSTNGIITAYNVYVSADGTAFANVATGTWADDRTEKSVFTTPVSASYVRLEATAGDGGFASAAEVNVEASVGTIIAHSQMSATATSAHTGYEASKAIDDSTTTVWHTEWNPMANLPQSITLYLGGTYSVNEVTYLPRQDASSNGIITSYKVYASSDGTTFTLIASGTWTDDQTAKAVLFVPVNASYVKLEATVGDSGFASAAEVNVEY